MCYVAIQALGIVFSNPQQFDSLVNVSVGTVGLAALIYTYPPIPVCHPHPLPTPIPGICGSTNLKEMEKERALDTVVSKFQQR